MATKKAVGTALTLLSRAYGGEVTREKADVYAAALKDVSDLQLQAGVSRVIQEYRAAFIPPPAVIREACGANAEPVLDVERVRAEIDRLGTYHPNGWINARPETVRQTLGDAVADAYAEAGGGAQLFADNETTRSIALRDLQRGLRSAVRVYGVAALPEWAQPRGIGSDSERKRLGSGGEDPTPEPDVAA